MQRIITINKERLDKAKTKAGGYTSKQLRLIGVAWPPKKGWPRKVIGTQMTLQQFVDFVAAGGNSTYLSEVMAMGDEQPLTSE